VESSICSPAVFLSQQDPGSALINSPYIKSCDALQ
jgi:hypothetical protein